jgi:hypothetical protein
LADPKLRVTVIGDLRRLYGCAASFTMLSVASGDMCYDVEPRRNHLMRRWTIFIATTFVGFLTTIGTAFAQAQSDGIEVVGGAGGTGGEEYVGGTAATGSDVSMTMVAIAILVVAGLISLYVARRWSLRPDADSERAQPIA